jgi:hypothetical protein
MSEDDSDAQPRDSFERFVARLGELRGLSRLRIGEMATRTETPRSVLYEVFGGKILPSWNRLEVILVTLGDAAAKEGHPSAVNLEEWKQLHTRARESREERRASPSGVQSNIFQSGRDYAYIQHGQVVVGSNNFSTSASGDNDDQVDQTTEYLAELENEITSVAKAARRRLIAYRFLRFAALASSAVTPAVALLNAAALITAGIGTVAFLCEGTIQLTRINERAVLDTKRISRLSREFRMYRTQVGDYSSGNTFTLLVKRVEEIREQNDNERLDVVQQSFGAHVSSNDQRSIVPS